MKNNNQPAGIKKNRERKNIPVDKNIYEDYKAFLEKLSEIENKKIFISQRIRLLIITDIKKIIKIIKKNGGQI